MCIASSTSIVDVGWMIARSWFSDFYYYLFIHVGISNYKEVILVFTIIDTPENLSKIRCIYFTEHS